MSHGPATPTVLVRENAYTQQPNSTTVSNLQFKTFVARDRQPNLLMHHHAAVVFDLDESGSNARSSVVELPGLLARVGEY